MGFYKNIMGMHGTSAVSSLKFLPKSYKKLAQAKNNRIFLLRCRAEDVSPSHINNYFKKLHRTCHIHHKYYKDFENAINRFKKTLLNLEIKSSNYNIIETERTIVERREYCKTLLTTTVMVEFEEKQKILHDQKHEKIKTRQINKFNKLHRQACNITGNDKWFVNLTKKDIPVDIKQSLSLGSKYSIPFENNKIPIENLISDVEYFIQHSVNEEGREVVRGQCVNAITNYQNQNKNKLIKKNNSYAPTRHIHN